MAPLRVFSVEPGLVGPSQPLSPGVPVAQRKRESRFLDFLAPQKHFAAPDLKAALWPLKGTCLLLLLREGATAERGNERHVPPGGDRGLFIASQALGDCLNHPALDPADVFCREGFLAIVTRGPLEKT